MIFDYVKQCYAEAEYPALDSQIQEWNQTKPLAGIKILDSTPVCRNTLLKYMPLLAAGAKLTVGISEIMPYDEKILRMLVEYGIPVVDARTDAPRDYDLILDCAGAFARWPTRYGVSELTRSGAHVYADAGEPVFLADGGRIKRIETCLGTGDSFIRAMEQLGYRDWQGRRIVVFGSGKVGTGIIYRAYRHGAVIDAVTDPETLSPFTRSMIHRWADYRNREEVIQLVEGAWALVTATGFQGVVEQYGITEEIIRSGTLLANMGVEDEFGASFPASAALNGKRSLNFILEDPTQVKYIDATMALHNEGALYLRNVPYRPGIVNPPAEIEEAILETTRRHGLLTKKELELI